MVSKIHLNDFVIILSGNYKNKIGIVKKILFNDRFLINELMCVEQDKKQHFSKRRILIHKSNLAIYDRNLKKIFRIGFLKQNNKKIRVLKETKKYLNI